MGGGIDPWEWAGTKSTQVQTNSDPCGLYIKVTKVPML